MKIWHFLGKIRKKSLIYKAAAKKKKIIIIWHLKNIKFVCLFVSYLYVAFVFSGQQVYYQTWKQKSWQLSCPCFPIWPRMWSRKASYIPATEENHITITICWIDALMTCWKCAPSTKCKRRILHKVSCPQAGVKEAFTHDVCRVFPTIRGFSPHFPQSKKNKKKLKISHFNQIFVSSEM